MRVQSWKGNYVNLDPCTAWYMLQFIHVFASVLLMDHMPKRSLGCDHVLMGAQMDTNMLVNRKISPQLQACLSTNYLFFPLLFVLAVQGFRCLLCPKDIRTVITGRQLLKASIFYCGEQLFGSEEQGYLCHSIPASNSTQKRFYVKSLILGDTG